MSVLKRWNGTTWEPILSSTDNKELIAEDYEVKSYDIGDYAIYNDKLYKCKTTITTGEAWIANKWDPVLITGEIANLQITTTIDKTLSIEDRPADAAAVGIYTNGISIPITWDNEITQGGLRTSNGTEIDSSNSNYGKRCRTGFIQIPLFGLNIEILNGYKVSIIQYESNTIESYVGTVSDGWVTSYNINTPTYQYIRLIIAKTDHDQNITPEDCSNKIIITGNNFTDETLTLQHKAADAAAVGASFDAVDANFEKTLMYHYSIDAGDDLNEFIVPGIYYVKNVSTILNAPISGYGMLQVNGYAGNTNKYLQIFINPTGKTYVRFYNTHWGDWYQLANQSNIDILSTNLNTLNINTNTSIDNINSNIKDIFSIIGYEQYTPDDGVGYSGYIDENNIWKDKPNDKATSVREYATEGKWKIIYVKGHLDRNTYISFLTDSLGKEDSLGEKVYPYETNLQTAGILANGEISRHLVEPNEEVFLEVPDDCTHVVVLRYYTNNGCFPQIFGAIKTDITSQVTSLNEEVKELDNEIENIDKRTKQVIGQETLKFKSGYLWFDNSIGGCEIIPREGSLYVCAVTECSAGDKFTINVYGGSTSHQRSYAFLNSELTPIGKAYGPYDKLCENQTIIAPENAAYLIINNKLSELSDGYYAIRGGGIIEDRLSVIEKVLDNDGNTAQIPDYYNENNYLTNKIDTLVDQNLIFNGNSDSFIFITDYHAHKNSGHSPAIINKIYTETGISKLFFGGDIGTSKNISALKTNAKAMKMLRESVPNLYAAVGNHEWKESYSTEPALPGTFSSVYNYYINQMESGCSKMSDFGDYWIDSKAVKIRYFFLNQNSSAFLTDISLKWFINELSTVPPGYGIVVVMHHGYHNKTYKTLNSRTKMGMLNWWENEVGQRNLTVRRISQILDAIRTGSTVKYALYPFTSNTAKERQFTPRAHTTAEKNSCGNYNPLESTFEEGTNTGAYTDIVTFNGAQLNKNGVYPIAIFCGHKHEDGAYDPASATSFDDMTNPDTVYLLNGKWYRYNFNTDSESDTEPDTDSDTDFGSESESDYEFDPDSESSSSSDTTPDYTDRVELLAASGTLDGNDEPIFSPTETVPPILIILTTTDCYKLNHPDTDPTIRQLGTISEQAFDVVQIDTRDRKVYCMRIGAGLDREFSYLPNTVNFEVSQGGLLASGNGSETTPGQTSYSKRCKTDFIQVPPSPIGLYIEIEEGFKFIPLHYESNETTSYVGQTESSWVTSSYVEIPSGQYIRVLIARTDTDEEVSPTDLDGKIKITQRFYSSSL